MGNLEDPCTLSEFCDNICEKMFCGRPCEKTFLCERPCERTLFCDDIVCEKTQKAFSNTSMFTPAATAYPNTAYPNTADPNTADSIANLADFLLFGISFLSYK